MNTFRTYEKGLIYAYLLKHYCPDCGIRMKVSYSSRVVSGDSPEGKEYLDMFYEGMVTKDFLELRKYHLKCPQCDRIIGFKEMHELKKEKRSSSAKQ